MTQYTRDEVEEILRRALETQPLETLSHEDLVAAALIAYPRYYHPGTGTACPVSVTIKAIEHDLAMRNTAAASGER